MAGGSGKLYVIIEPDSDYIGNDFEMIENLTGSLKSQIGD